MNYKIVISRRNNPDSPIYEETFEHNGNRNITVTDFLTELNNREEIICSDGKVTSPVAWECSCMEQKCGACAMLINGRPALACSIFLNDAADKAGTIHLAPLSKFPVVRDLKVDRKAIFDMLTEMKVCPNDRNPVSDGNDHHQLSSGTPAPDKEELKPAYKSSKCLMCGCCLEICPNYICGSSFGGAVALTQSYKSLNQNSTDTHYKEIKRKYLKHFFNGCGVSLSCQDICPAEIPIDELQSRSNARAVWGRKSKT